MSRSFTTSRRGFLASAGGAVAAAAIYGFSAAPAWADPRFPRNPFTLGVASGDPTPDGIVLWTRLAPEPQAADGMGGMPPYKIQVTWQVATDPGFRTVVKAGSEQATPELAHSVHAEVSGLLPSRDYWYRFLVGTEESPVGHTRTAPAAGTDPSRLTFALASCQSWAGGRYAAYRTMAQEDLDLVVHVGDYIYEGRNHESLADFRNNHAKYKSSVDLQAAHARFPFVVTFDDHEVENNWADGVSQPDNEASNDPGPSCSCGPTPSRHITSIFRFAARSGPPARTWSCTAAWTTVTWPASTSWTPGSTGPTS